MPEQEKKIQPNFDDVVQSLTNHIAMLSADNAMLNSVVQQQDKLIQELLKDTKKK